MIVDDREDIEPLVYEKTHEWGGIKLPEVPEEYFWTLDPRNLPKGNTLTLRAKDRNDPTGFVLWAIRGDPEVRIAPLGVENCTRIIEGSSIEESLHVATTYVLLGMWEGET